MFEGLGGRLLVSDDVFDWDTLPGSVAVFGPGIVGLELGQALLRLGVRVRLFGYGKPIGPLTDPALQDEAARLLGVDLRLRPDATVLGVQRTGDGVSVTCTGDGGEVTERFDGLLAATGRVANVDNLGLENTTLTRNERGGPTR